MKIVNGKSYFLADCSQEQYSYLNENIKCDILIVGGGITSLIVAYFLLELKLDIVIVEKGRIAHKSTSITTALIQYELDDNYSKLKDYFNDKELEDIYIGSFNAVRELEQIIMELNFDVDLKSCDSVLYTNTPTHVKDLGIEYSFRKNIGLDCIYENINLDQSKCSIIAKNSGISFNPVKFSNEMASYLSDHGVRIFENTKVVEVLDKKAIVCCDNTIEFEKIICATGYNTSLFTNRVLCKKEYTYNIVTQPNLQIPNDLKKLLIRDNNDPYHYYRCTLDNRIIAGGCDNYMSNFKIEQDCYDNLKKKIYDIYKLNIDIDYCYNGVFGSTKDNLGLFGSDKTKDNVIYALGYGANGIVFACLGGKIIADELMNRPNSFAKYFDVNRKNLI